MKSNAQWMVLAALVLGCDDGGENVANDDGGVEFDGGQTSGDAAGDGAPADSALDGGTLDSEPQTDAADPRDDAALADDANIASDMSLVCAEGAREACDLDGCTGQRRCVAGEWTACAGTDERCDEADNDCDGNIDEDFGVVGDACSVGEGSCARDGSLVCNLAADAAICNAVAGPPGGEICDTFDNDCDGVVDEDVCPRCGDGNLDPGEACDDGNALDDDGCSSICEVEGPTGGTVMVCGMSALDVATIPDAADDIGVMAGCEPEPSTIALLVTRSGTLDFGPETLQLFVARGGNVITEYGSSDEVFNALFGTEIEQGLVTGSCSDAINPLYRFNTDDAFWTEHAGLPVHAGEDGCGFDLIGFPGITRLGGWNDYQVSLAYRAYGQGRVWLVESDWQDGNATFGDASRQMMRSMIRWRPAARAPGVQQNVSTASLEARGFSECYAGDFADRTALDPILAGCAGADLVIGCRPTGAATLTLSAEGDYEQVTYDVGDSPVATHAHNGVEWYFSAESSWGFAPAGEAVLRNTCDVVNEREEERMCWHTSDNMLIHGYRCGADFPNMGAYERVIYTRGEPDPVRRAELGALQGYGHHGNCDTFNACGDAETCANAACRHLNQGPALSWREGGCVDIQAENPGFRCNPFQALPGDLQTDWQPGGCNLPMAYDVVCEAQEPLSFEGVRTEITADEIDLGGFTECWTGLYADVGPNYAAIDAACDGDVLLMGCSLEDAPGLSLGAMGLRAEVTLDSGEEQADSHTHNGVEWYRSANGTWGFAPGGLAVRRSSCDVEQVQMELRMCWHAAPDGLQPGWSCGAERGQVNARRTIYHRTGRL